MHKPTDVSAGPLNERDLSTTDQETPGKVNSVFNLDMASLPKEFEKIHEDGVTE